MRCSWHSSPVLLTVMGVCLLVALSGCQRRGPEVVKVTGRITMNGQPVSNVVVQFTPESGRPSACRTDDNGNYAPEFSSDIPHGVVPGTHRVSIQVTPERIGEPVDLNDTAKYHPEMPLILQHFGSWNASPLIVEVAPGGKQLDIELQNFLPDETEAP